MGQGSGLAVSCDVGHRQGSDHVLLWLWCGPAAVAPLLLAWEPPHAAVGAALKRQKAKKTNKQTNPDWNDLLKQKSFHSRMCF